MSLTGSLDTNVLVRLLVPGTVVLELEWVLRSRYKFSKAAVIKTYSGLLASIELAFESKAALEQALASYEEGAADFGEYLHLALAQYGQALPFWTFDAKASKAAGAKVLKPR